MGFGSSLASVLPWSRLVLVHVPRTNTMETTKASGNPTNYMSNKTVLLRDCKRRTARAPHLQKFQKCLSNFLSKTLSIFCPKFCPTFLSKFGGGGGTPGPPPVWGVPTFLSKFGGGGVVPPGAPPPQFGGVPRGHPPVGGYPRGAPPPSWGGPPCEQTNWKHYLPVILRMRAVIMQLHVPFGRFYSEISNANGVSHWRSLFTFNLLQELEWGFESLTERTMQQKSSFFQIMKLFIDFWIKNVSITFNGSKSVVFKKWFFSTKVASVIQTRFQWLPNLYRTVVSVRYASKRWRAPMLIPVPLNGFTYSCFATKMDLHKFSLDTSKSSIADGLTSEQHGSWYRIFLSTCWNPVHGRNMRYFNKPQNSVGLTLPW